jgi:hypothetical protein
MWLYARQKVLQSTSADNVVRTHDFRLSDLHVAQRLCSPVLLDLALGVVALESSHRSCCASHVRHSGLMIFHFNLRRHKPRRRRPRERYAKRAVCQESDIQENGMPRERYTMAKATEQGFDSNVVLNSQTMSYNVIGAGEHGPQPCWLRLNMAALAHVCIFCASKSCLRSFGDAASHAIQRTVHFTCLKPRSGECIARLQAKGRGPSTQ